MVGGGGIWDREGREIWAGGGKIEKKPKTEGMRFWGIFLFFLFY
jgi:hypothetical protein